MSNNNRKTMSNQNVNKNTNKENNQQIKAFLYKEEDINMILKMLTQAKPDFENIELFYLLKKVLLNPIPFGTKETK